MYVCSVNAYGAAPDAEHLQTEAFQNAIDACFSAGGGEVEVPAGRYIIGDIRLRSNVTLHLLKNAEIYGSRNAEDYCNINNDVVEPLPKEHNEDFEWRSSRELKKLGQPKNHVYTAGSRWNHGIIRAVFAENIGIIGEEGSVINGGNVYDPKGEEHYRGPHAINMHYCKNVTLKGYTVSDSSNWAHSIFFAEDVDISDITVLAGHDAIHITACDRVKIENCKLITGDDCIAGIDNRYISVKNCEISSACSAFRFGGYDISVEDCKVYGPCRYQFRGSFTPEEKAAGVTVSEKGRNNMLSFWTNYSSDEIPTRTPPGKIRVKNCTVLNADRMLHLNLSGNETWQWGDPPSDISFENIKAENILMGLTAYGTAGLPYEFVFKNSEYSFRDGSGNTPMMRVAHFGKIRLENVKISGFEGGTLIKTWTDGGMLETEGLQCDLKGGKLIEKTEEQFVCKAI